MIGIGGPANLIVGMYDIRLPGVYLACPPGHTAHCLLRAEEPSALRASLSQVRELRPAFSKLISKARFSDPADVHATLPCFEFRQNTGVFECVRRVLRI